MSSHKIIEIGGNGPGIRRVLAPNPSPMTQTGTNTYVLGRGRVAVIDPGPDDPAHLAAILAAMQADEVITHILVTHSHLDHSPLSRRLAAFSGAPVLAFGPAQAGRSATMVALERLGGIGGGEGVDQAFVPDIRLRDGEVIDGDGWRIEALHTPGHMANHMCFCAHGAVFTGDHVMGWASSLISPPDGEMGAFMASCQRLAARDDRVYYPGHGAPVTSPADCLAWLIAHRQGRETQILAALADGPATPRALTQHVYGEVDPRLHPAAERNVLAHLIDLWEQNRVYVDPHIRPDAEYSVV